jgi:hypothetical protein
MAVPPEGFAFVGGEVEFEVGAGGIEVDEVDLQAQQVGHGEEDIVPRLVGGLQQEGSGRSTGVRNSRALSGRSRTSLIPRRRHNRSRNHPPPRARERVIAMSH